MTIEVRVDNRLRILLDELPAEVADQLREEFTYTNPQYAKLRGMGFFPGANEPALIRSWRVDTAWLTLPRGGMQRVRETLKKAGLQWRVTDRRTEGERAMAGKLPPTSVALYDYQVSAVDAAVERQNCVVRAPTGSGKTSAAIAIASRLNLPTIVIVWNAGLYEQWVKRLQAELGLMPHEIGHVRGSKFKLRSITMAMQQTLNKLDDALWRLLQKTFGVVICDEVQRFAATTFLQTIDRFPAKYRIGISADETRKDRKEFLIYDLFGSIAYEVSKEELVERAFVHDVEVRIVPTSFSAPWYVAQRKSGQNPNFNRLLEQMTADVERNALVIRYAVNNNDGKQVLVFSHRREHCVRLEWSIIATSNISTGLMLGGPDGADEFRRTVEGIKAGKIEIGFGTIQAIGQGLDLPSVSRGVVATPLASNKQFWGQVCGRLCRTAEGKQDAIVYYLWDRAVYGLTHVENLCKWSAHVRVLHNGGWTDAREWLKGEKHGGTASEGDGGTSGDLPWTG